MKSNFSLIPFAVEDSPEIELIGNIERQENLLAISYKLDGISEVKLPQIITQPTRQFNLWEHTCFEFFLGLKGSSQYWEFNLSPTGHWNVFRFPNYRHDITEEMSFNSLPFHSARQNNSLELNLEIDLSLIVSAQQDLEVGITAVVEATKAQLSYWALIHPGTEADFHRRDSFKIDL